MSKSYLLLIGALVLVVLAVGGFAIFRSATNPASNPPSASPSRPNTNPSVQPVVEPPLPNQISLTVNSPKNGQTVASPSLIVSGKTVPNADVAVNEKDVKANASGNFSATITLDEGENDISVVASDDAGNSSEWDATVTYAPAQ